MDQIELIFLVMVTRIKSTWQGVFGQILNIQYCKTTIVDVIFVMSVPLTNPSMLEVSKTYWVGDLISIHTKFISNIFSFSEI